MEQPTIESIRDQIEAGAVIIEIDGEYILADGDDGSAYVDGITLDAEVGLEAITQFCDTLSRTMFGNAMYSL